ncbi:MAG TPA: hypothetical protein VF598_04260, partial [Hymenobacter sp.]
EGVGGALCPLPTLSSMTLAEFHALPYEPQLATVHATGTYLARRRQEEYEACLLYEMPSRFFVELTYHIDTNEIQYLFAFEAGSENDRLPDYAMVVRLPDWLPESE